MPIDSSELNRSFIVVNEQATVAEVRTQIAAKGRWTYIVIRLQTGQYVALQPAQLMELLLASPVATSQQALLAAHVYEIEAALSPLASASVEQSSMSTSAALALRDTLSNHRLVVLQSGEVVGVLDRVERGAVISNPSEEAFNKLPAVDSRARAVPPPAAMAPPSPAFLGGTLGLEDVASAADAVGSALPPTPSAEPAPPVLPTTGGGGPAAIPPPVDQRFVNVEIEDQAHDQPLQLDQSYTLDLYVDTQAHSESVVQDVAFKLKFQPDEQLIEVTVQLASDDFEILTDSQTLRVPPQGCSANKARFDFKPKHAGAGQISAVLLKDNTFIQLINIKLQVGGAAGSGAIATEILGQPLAGMAVANPRDVSLTILNTGNSFTMVLTTPAVCANATVPLTFPQLDQMIIQVRKEMQAVVYLMGGTPPSYVYQTRLDIPPEVNEAALQKLAMSGFRLYQEIFFGPAAGADLQLIGKKLREMAQHAQLKIRIISQQFLLPWGILYMADSYEPAHIDPALFLGLKHVIEHIPLQPNMLVIDSVIDSSKKLTVSLNVNAGIDQQMKMSFIADQLKYWDTIKSAGKVQVVVRETEADVQKALADTTTPDQILYFNCHAISKSLSEGGGPDDSMLVLTTPAAGLTLKDLSVFAGSNDPFPAAPLIFINACESAELSPLFYDGFVPYFMSKGARGVIGTECETPALFAAEFARRFFDEFLTGKPLGQVFLELRQEFYAKNTNIMGLLYALYCSADTVVAPAVQLAAAA
ncbi:MAG: CHAT domain-containing protein [Herpetosiphonaceae bacterium]|nr:CHAT domain-containing protein [Herpetosiphonaceae bacterium]